MRIRMPSPALVVAAAALIVALTGTAIAANVVPLAARAKVADNAKKLGGKTPAQVARTPGPATTARRQDRRRDCRHARARKLGREPRRRTRRPRGRSSPACIVDTTTACDQGQKAIGGGFQGPADNIITTLDSRPSSDGASWRLRLASFELENASVTLVAVCLK